MSSNDNAIICSPPLSFPLFAQTGQSLARMLQSGDTLLLTGDLGAGKTTLVQEIAKGLNVGQDQYVSSPSFALLHEYTGLLPIYHMDLYRLSDEDDVEAAGLTEYLGNGLCCIEWPDRLGAFIPDDRLEIAIEICNEETRSLKCMPHGSKWQSRIQQLHALINSITYE